MQMQQPQLSHYTKFYVTLGSMLKRQVITELQKSTIKSQLLKKDPQLLDMMLKSAQLGKENQLEEQLLAYISNLETSSPQNRKKSKAKTVTFDSPEERNAQQQIRTQVLQLTKLLQSSLTQESFKLSEDETKEYASLRSLLTAVSNKNERESFSRFRSCGSIEAIEEGQDDLETNDQSYEIIQMRMKHSYKELKQIFRTNVQTHMLLMQDDISYGNLIKVLKFMMKALVDAEDFCFVQKRQTWEMHSTNNNSIIDIQEQELFQQELSRMTVGWVNSIKHLGQYPTILKLCNRQYQTKTVVIKIPGKDNDVLVIYQLNTSKKSIKSKFLRNSNKYGCSQDIINLSQFLSETIIAGKVQIINPLAFADEILDLGLGFMKISKFLFVECIKRSLEISYKVDKLKSFESILDKKSQVTIDFQDVRLEIHDIDLNDPPQRQIYLDAFKMFQKYENFLKLCSEKVAYYKYFLRTQDHLLMDFNKSGELVFLSRPISSAMIKQHVSLNIPEAINRNISYTEIFVRNHLLADIEMSLSQMSRKNVYYHNSDHAQYEILLKIQDETYKGFAVIFHEQQHNRMQSLNMFKTERDIQESKSNTNSSKSLEKDIQKQIAKSVYRHNTYKYIQQLELTNIDVRNSMISLFLPDSDSSPKKSRIKQLTETPIIDVDESDTSSPEVQRGLEDLYSPALIKPKKVQLGFKYKGHSDQLRFIHYVDKSIKISNKIFQETFEDYGIEQSQFNIFDIPSLEEKQRLIYVMLRRRNYIDQYKIDLTKLSHFLNIIQHKYDKRSNPFHCYDHGVSVMQSCYYFTSLQRTKASLKDINMFTLMISGLCHDVCHTGRSNLFEINSRSKLAVLYHEKSPLEQHHAATTMFVLQKQKSSITSELCPDDERIFRRSLIDNILATDIKQHFNLLQEFQNKKNVFNNSDEDLKLMSAMIIHTADFNGGTKKYEVAKIWSERVNQEFKAQYEMEGKLNIPQTPFLKGLENPVVMARGEMNFSKVIVRPLWAALNEFYVQIKSYQKDNALEESVNNIDNTILNWEKLANTA